MMRMQEFLMPVRDRDILRILLTTQEVVVRNSYAIITLLIRIMIWIQQFLKGILTTAGSGQL